jgi:hypothetical protein
MDTSVYLAFDPIGMFQMLSCEKGQSNGSRKSAVVGAALVGLLWLSGIEEFVSVKDGATVIITACKVCKLKRLNAINWVWDKHLFA